MYTWIDSVIVWNKIYVSMYRCGIWQLSNIAALFVYVCELKLTYLLNTLLLLLSTIQSKWMLAEIRMAKEQNIHLWYKPIDVCMYLCLPMYCILDAYINAPLLSLVWIWCVYVPTDTCMHAHSYERVLCIFPVRHTITANKLTPC